MTGSWNTYLTTRLGTESAQNKTNQRNRCFTNDNSCNKNVADTDISMGKLVQEWHNSIANALELRLSCTNPSMYYPICHTQVTYVCLYSFYMIFHVKFDDFCYFVSVCTQPRCSNMCFHVLPPEILELSRSPATRNPVLGVALAMNLTNGFMFQYFIYEYVRIRFPFRWRRHMSVVDNQRYQQLDCLFKNFSG